MRMWLHDLLRHMRTRHTMISGLVTMFTFRSSGFPLWNFLWPVRSWLVVSAYWKSPHGSRVIRKHQAAPGLASHLWPTLPETTTQWKSTMFRSFSYIFLLQMGDFHQNMVALVGSSSAAALRPPPFALSRSPRFNMLCRTSSFSTWLQNDGNWGHHEICGDQIPPQNWGRGVPQLSFHLSSCVKSTYSSWMPEIRSETPSCHSKKMSGWIYDRLDSPLRLETSWNDIIPGSVSLWQNSTGANVSVAPWFAARWRGHCCPSK